MTEFSTEVIALLEAPLAREHVKTRQQAGRTVSYIEAWHVIAEANRIFGFAGWNREMVECKCVAERECRIGVGTQYEKDGWRVGYVARVRVTVGPVVREGCGYGSGIDQDLGAAHESAVKECESDAMKRALMTFGNQFGLALYDKAQSNVESPTRTADKPARTASGKHPKWDYAGARFRELENALKGAHTEKDLHEIIALNEQDIKLIGELHWQSHQRLMILRDEVIDKLRRPPSVNAGSAPALMGEP